MKDGQSDMVMFFCTLAPNGDFGFVKLEIICNVGAKYAVMLLKIEIAYILNSYHLSTSIKEVTKRDLKADLLVRSRIGFPIKFTKRIKL